MAHMAKNATRLGSHRHLGLLTVLVFALSACAGQRPAVAPLLTAARMLAVLEVPNVAEAGAVVVLDPADGRLLYRLRVGYDPALAASLDGSRLYVASNATAPDGQPLPGRPVPELWVVDRISGQIVAKSPLPDRAMNTMPTSTPSLAVSVDGRYVYALRMRTLVPGTDRHSVAVLDAASGRELADVELPGCVFPSLLPVRDGLRVACLDGGAVFAITPGADGRFPAERWQLDAGMTVATAATGPESARLLVVTPTGVLFEFDGSLRVVRQRLLDVPAAKEAHGVGAVSSDGRLLYVGLRNRGANPELTDVVVVALDAWQQLRTVPLPVPVWSIDSGPPANLFAADRDGGSVFVLDGASVTVIRRLQGLATPALAIGR